MIEVLIAVAALAIAFVAGALVERAIYRKRVEDNVTRVMSRAERH
ncbi:hypothetical protein QIH87_50120 (plasmid) [Bradyrhizobium elkanii]|nr:hypothetical protein [Bradyrhizobium elkanii]WLB14789.1 hypothetical protein QIH87_50120 [Bradyrhizobium elkanii]WLB69120.1 hypothetical protein QIH89_27800 [Bradyrhizobium elkanii]